MKEELPIKKTIERVQIQEIFKKIEIQSGYQSSDIARIWAYMQHEMVQCFQSGKSIDLGEGFGCLQTSLFIPMESTGNKRNPRFQVRFKAGSRLKRQLEIPRSNNGR